MDLVTMLFSASPDSTQSPLPAWDGPDTLVLAFGSGAWLEAPGAFRSLLEAYPSSCVLGCSTAGEIHGAQVHDDRLSVAVARFAHTRLRRAEALVTGPAGSAQAAETLADQLAGPGLRAVLLLSDGLMVNGSELSRTLGRRLGPEVAITGGLAGDGPRFQRTWVLTPQGPATGRVTAVGFYGEALLHRCGSKGGWDTFGPQRLVTRSEGNVLYELDGTQIQVPTGKWSGSTWP